MSDKKEIYVQNYVSVISDNKGKLEVILNRIREIMGKEQKTRLGQLLFTPIVEHWFELEIVEPGIQKIDEFSEDYCIQFMFETKNSPSKYQINQLVSRFNVDAIVKYSAGIGKETLTYGHAFFSKGEHEQFELDEEEIKIAMFCFENPFEKMEELIIEKIKNLIPDRLCKN